MLQMSRLLSPACAGALWMISGAAPTLSQPSPSSPSFAERFHFATEPPTEAEPQAQGLPAPSMPQAVPPDVPAAGASVAKIPAQPDASEQTGRQIGQGRAGFYEGAGRTASGEQFNPEDFTAAHATLPLGTRVRVVNVRNKKSVTVRVNDRTPPNFRFVINLSRASARAIGIDKTVGTGLVALFAVNQTAGESSSGRRKAE